MYDLQRIDQPHSQPGFGHVLIPYTVCVQVDLKNYQSNPSLFDINYSPASIGIKLVGYGPCSTKTRPACHSSGPSPNLPETFELYLPPKDSNPLAS